MDVDRSDGNDDDEDEDPTTKLVSTSNLFPPARFTMQSVPLKYQLVSFHIDTRFLADTDVRFLSPPQPRPSLASRQTPCPRLPPTLSTRIDSFTEHDRRASLSPCSTLTRRR